MYAKSATYAKRRGGNSTANSPSPLSSSSSSISSSSLSSLYDDGVQTIAEAYAILERDPEWLVCVHRQGEREIIIDRNLSIG